MKYLLDISVSIQPLKRQPLPSVIARWQSVGDEACPGTARAAAPTRQCTRVETS